jgi:hypothetical protein
MGAAPAARAEPVLLDPMDDPGLWQAAPASGVEMRLSADTGYDGGGALRVDFDFRGGGGWAAFRRVLPVRLPENYEISFWIRGDAPENTLEFKLIDATGENVWWVHRPRFAFAGGWRQVTFRRRHVEFAWGPLGGGEIRDVAALEFAITAGTGGSGTVWIDRITLTPREPVRPYDLVPAVHATADAAGAAAVLDDDTVTAWRPAAGVQALTLDFLRHREYGGVILHWDPHGALRTTTWTSPPMAARGRRCGRCAAVPVLAITCSCRKRNRATCACACCAPPATATDCAGSSCSPWNGAHPATGCSRAWPPTRPAAASRSTSAGCSRTGRWWA